jgi:hypothetical protein
MALFSRLTNRRRSVAAAHHRARFRPRLEMLEDRALPSTLTVTNNLDSGPGSLRAEIAAARKGDTIVFAASLSGQTIALSSTELSIPKNLTIQGPGGRPAHDQRLLRFPRQHRHPRLRDRRRRHRNHRRAND